MQQVAVAAATPDPGSGPFPPTLRRPTPLPQFPHMEAGCRAREGARLRALCQTGDPSRPRGSGQRAPAGRGSTCRGARFRPHRIPIAPCGWPAPPCAPLTGRRVPRAPHAAHEAQGPGQGSPGQRPLRHGTPGSHGGGRRWPGCRARAARPLRSRWPRGGAGRRGGAAGGAGGVWAGSPSPRLGLRPLWRVTCRAQGGLGLPHAPQTPLTHPGPPHTRLQGKEVTPQLGAAVGSQRVYCGGLRTSDENSAPPQLTVTLFTHPPRPLIWGRGSQP